METGMGMGATLNLTVQAGAYTISDRATLLAFANKADHSILFEGDVVEVSEDGKEALRQRMLGEFPFAEDVVITTAPDGCSVRPKIVLPGSATDEEVAGVLQRLSSHDRLSLAELAATLDAVERRPEFVDKIANRLDNLEIGSLLVAANVVGLARHTSLNDGDER